MRRLAAVHFHFLLALTFLYLAGAGCGGGDPVEPDPGRGTVYVNVYPNEPALPWRLTRPDGGTVPGAGDTALVDQPAGFYTIHWDTLDLWLPPSPVEYRRNLPDQEAIVFTGAYRHGSEAYPQVSGVEAVHGPEPGVAEVRWMWYINTEHPAVVYEVALNLVEPVNQYNWDGSDVVRQVLHDPGQVGYACLFDAGDGLVPGQEVWFAVRAVDAEGWSTWVFESPSLIVSHGWWAEGRVIDPLGRPVPGAVVTCEQVEGQIISAADGSYRVGPLVDQEDIVLRVEAGGALPPDGARGWYRFRSPPFRFQGDPNFDILVMPRYVTDEACDTYLHSFLTMLRLMTKTEAPNEWRPDQKICTWEEYPLRVHVADFVRDDGLDYGANCREALEIWNLLLEREIFVTEGVESDLAQVLIRYEDTGAMVNGVTELGLPLGHGTPLGYIVPERLDVKLNSVILTDDQRVQETCLHELGHVLGLYRHISDCHGLGYLMDLTAAGALDGGIEGAVHPDEMHMLQVILHLPRWMDLAGFY